jgi:membrane protein YqaA with SNARE-associated domain
VLESLQAAGGIYVAMFIFAIVSGVFPLVNSELALGTLAIVSHDLPQSLALAVIIALGQTISHSTLFQTSRGVTDVGAKRREKLQARIARARATVERWRDKWLLLLFAAATLGIPPMMLVSIVAGALGFRFRSFVIVGLIGRIIRFTAIAIAAHYL